MLLDQTAAVHRNRATQYVTVQEIQSAISMQHKVWALLVDLGALPCRGRVEHKCTRIHPVAHIGGALWSIVLLTVQFGILRACAVTSQTPCPLADKSVLVRACPTTLVPACTDQPNGRFWLAVVVEPTALLCGHAVHCRYAHSKYLSMRRAANLRQLLYELGSEYFGRDTTHSAYLGIMKQVISKGQKLAGEYR